MFLVSFFAGSVRSPLLTTNKAQKSLHNRQHFLFWRNTIHSDQTLNVTYFCLRDLNEGQCFISLPSRNLLSVLPKYLFSLPLKVLLVSNNKLVSIPEEIGKAKELMELVSMASISVRKSPATPWSQSNPISCALSPLAGRELQ